MLLFAAALSLAAMVWQTAAGASGLFGDPGCASGLRGVIGWLDAQAAACPALTPVFVGAPAGLLAYLALCRFRVAGLTLCVLCGIAAYALIRGAATQFGVAVPAGVSPAALGIGFVGCIATLVGLRAAQWV